jgi:hypothetical protein
LLCHGPRHLDYGLEAAHELTAFLAQKGKAMGVSENPLHIPIVINCRDRVSALRALVAWLEHAGYQRIYFVDNDSSYQPLVDYYNKTPHTVLRLEQNLGHKAPWLSGIVDQIAQGGYYIVSDPDVVPVEGCPADAVAVFYEALRRFPQYVKAGFGLKIDDLPDTYRFKDQVQWWEARAWSTPIASSLFDAGIDTTFALYRPGSPFRLWPALRTGPPYVARHMAWYIDSDNLPEEEQYYRQNARPDASFWEKEELRGAIDHEQHVRLAMQDLVSTVPAEAKLVLIDQDEWGAGATLDGRRLFPFLERDGQYWGPPPDDATAVEELERLRRAGARFVVIAWPAFWWLDYYAQFHKYLRSSFECVLANDRVVIFGTI